MTADTSIFDLRSILGAQIREATGANPFETVTVDPNTTLIEVRLTPAEAQRLIARLDNPKETH